MQLKRNCIFRHNIGYSEKNPGPNQSQKNMWCVTPFLYFYPDCLKIPMKNGLFHKHYPERSEWRMSRGWSFGIGIRIDLYIGSLILIEPLATKHANTIEAPSTSSITRKWPQIYVKHSDYCRQIGYLGPICLKNPQNILKPLPHRQQGCYSHVHEQFNRQYSLRSTLFAHE